MRLPARLVIAALAVLATGLAAGCTAAPGAAEANDARPAAHSATPGPATASKPAKVEPQAATASDKPSAPAVPPLKVVGAPRGVKAKEGILADAATGQLLWAKSANVERPMASITKVMTAYLVIQAGDVDRDLKVPRGVENYVFEYGASSDGLHPGEVLTARQLLYGLLLQSGADAAYTLASAYGPGMKAFIAKMNATARELGMLHTHFASPDGLPYPTESSTYSTPDDLLRLGEVAMESPLFRAIVDTPFYSMKKGDGHAAHWWDNDNPLIGEYSGAIGIKTGFTDLAGHCLLFEAVRHGRPLIGVVLGSPPTGPAAAAQDATKVLNWGFSLKQAA